MPWAEPVLTDAGTGFGLSVVERIVTAHDWAIDVTTAEADGARFEVADIELLDSDDRSRLLPVYVRLVPALSSGND